ncbi:hypothetical protein BD311DRAFT_797719 [Dichomitus squalens]|uniref:Uncharacterized protein n=1 Tax=Dichomitus squalens TaxID=114155 RepID=A0A4Q9MJA3_9APHY|nr:hypothetical protein BD311DRAFT_797719 [Dichomitus squalens]
MRLTVLACTAASINGVPRLRELEMYRVRRRRTEAIPQGALFPDSPLCGVAAYVHLDFAFSGFALTVEDSQGLLTAHATRIAPPGRDQHGTLGQEGASSYPFPSVESIAGGQIQGRTLSTFVEWCKISSVWPLTQARAPIATNGCDCYGEFPEVRLQPGLAGYSV